jgi:hypothetical protein
MEGEGKAEGEKAGVTCFQGLAPPPPHASPGANSAQSVPLTPPSSLSAWPVTSFCRSPPPSVDLLNGHAHEVPRGLV